MVAVVASALAGRLGGEILNRKFSDHRSRSFGRLGPEATCLAAQTYSRPRGAATKLG